MAFTLGEDIALLAITEDGRLAGGQKLRFALAGAELVQLAARRRVDVVDGRIRVLDSTPTGERLLDAALQDIQNDKRPPQATKWVARPRSLVDAYLEQLAARAIVHRDVRKVMRVFLSVRWNVIDTVAQTQARARLDAVAYSSGPVDAVESAFGALVHTAGLDRLIYPDARSARNDAARARLKQIARRDSTATTVRDATEARAADAALDAALDASLHAAVSASVHAAHHAAHAHDGGAAGGGHHG